MYYNFLWMYMEIYVCCLIFFFKQAENLFLICRPDRNRDIFFQRHAVLFFYHSGNAKIPGKNNFGGDFLSVIALLS